MANIGDKQEFRVCSRCGEKLPIDQFYFVSKKLGTRRGKCKDCMRIVKAMQKDPNWKPECSRCGVRMERFGPGRRLCRKCFDESYDKEERRENGSHRAKLNPCRNCGEKRFRSDHISGTALCGICRSVPQHRRKRLKLFNLTPRQYLEMLDDQSYCCWICNRPFTKGRSPHVDHQHKEPRIIRGLLCSTCNTVLGLFKDDSNRLQNAANYLKYPPAQDMFPGKVAEEEANRADYRPMKRVKI